MIPNNANTYLPPTIAIPSALEISDISRSYPMIVTVNANSDQVNTYIAGQVVRLNVPYSYRMFQANGLNGKILSNTGTTLILDIDSRQFDIFVIPAITQEQPASLSPSGSQNLQYNNNTAQVGFQSYNDRGN